MTFAALQLFLALLAGMMSSMPAASQNPDATPTYGDEEIISPMTEALEIRVQAGGPVKAAQDLPPPCVGYIAGAPDFDLSYQPGGAPLYIYVVSDSDTTLAVTDPEGTWHCSDDDIGLDPVISIAHPPAGLYSIWVGAYRENTAERALLYISETPPEGQAD